MTRERAGTWAGVFVGVVLGTVVTGLWMEARVWRGEMERRVFALEARSGGVASSGDGESLLNNEPGTNVSAVAGIQDAPMGCGASGTVPPNSGIRRAAGGSVSAADWLDAAEGES